ncbi:MAG: ATP phosphoribosyltransferase [Clostridia bacterium]|nr:ATP phosphoribosyltransferase [Clostridia bacterium]
MLNIALPKGRLGSKVYKMLESIGYECPEILEDSRKLIFENSEAGVKYFLVKPSDVAIYVEYGAADIGVVGKDILDEGDFDIYELANLGFGTCRMAIAAKNEFREDFDRPLKVATKYPNIAKNYYNSKNREIEIIKLNGSIELAPVLGLSDVIVDIVETGTTLKENGLSVFEEILPISARLIANKSAFKFKEEEITKIVEAVKGQIK